MRSDAYLLPILVVVLLGDSSGGVEVSNGHEDRSRGHESSLTRTSTNNAAGKVGKPALHHWLSKGGHGVGHVALDDVWGIEGSILSRSLVLTEFNPVHGCRWE